MPYKNRQDHIEWAQAYYRRHRGHLNKKSREYYRRHHEEILAWQRAYDRRYKLENPKKLVQHRIRYRDVLRMETFAAYGGPICICCGETEPTFLSLEHTRNDGAKSKSLHGSGLSLYRWLRSQDFPQDLGIEVLCLNCQFGRARSGGMCPHEGHIASLPKRSA